LLNQHVNYFAHFCLIFLQKLAAGVASESRPRPLFLCIDLVAYSRSFLLWRKRKHAYVVKLMAMNETATDVQNVHLFHQETNDKGCSQNRLRAALF
jgi:hypothetical protein